MHLDFVKLFPRNLKCLPVSSWWLLALCHHSLSVANVVLVDHMDVFRRRLLLIIVALASILLLELAHKLVQLVKGVVGHVNTDSWLLVVEELCELICVIAHVNYLHSQVLLLLCYLIHWNLVLIVVIIILLHF